MKHSDKKSFIVEGSDGRVLRGSDAGLILGASDPQVYGNLDLARKVADEMMALGNIHGQTWKLYPKEKKL